MNENIKQQSDKELVLAVETSGRLGSVLIADSQKIVDEIEFSAPLKHNSEIFDAIASMLAKCEKNPKNIKQIYISIGPGSYTGLRIAASIAKSMALANDTRIVAVDSLDVIAQNASDYIDAWPTQNVTKKIAAIIDAKRGQFFIAIYNLNNGQWLKTTEDCLMTIAEFIKKFADPANSIYLLGEGLVYYKDDFAVDGIEFLNVKSWPPHARNVYKLGLQKALNDKFTDALELTPKYLRTPDAKPKKI